MTYDKGAGDGPYTTGDSDCLVFLNGRGVENFDSRRDAMNAASLANAIYAAGRKAERERCARIADGLLNLEVGDLVGTSIATKIRGGQDGK